MELEWLGRCGEGRSPIEIVRAPFLEMKMEAWSIGQQ